jgi:hypothetical protein
MLFSVQTLLGNFTFSGNFEKKNARSYVTLLSGKKYY